MILALVTVGLIFLKISDPWWQKALTVACALGLFNLIRWLSNKPEKRNEDKTKVSKRFGNIILNSIHFFSDEKIVKIDIKYENDTKKYIRGSHFIDVLLYDDKGYELGCVRTQINSPIHVDDKRRIAISVMVPEINMIYIKYKIRLLKEKSILQEIEGTVQ
jgi:hypothetical protein